MVRFGHPRFKRMLKKYDELNASVQENLVAIREVKTYVREDYEKDKFDAAAEDLRNAQRSAEKIFTLSGSVPMFVMWSCTIILLLLG